MAPTPQCPTRVARKLLKLTGIPVSRRTSFHANQARRKVCKEPKDLSSTNTPADHHCAIRINIVNLKHRLRYIDPDRANLADGRPHSTWLRFDATIQWQFGCRRLGAVNRIICDKGGQWPQVLDVRFNPNATKIMRQCNMSLRATFGLMQRKKASDVDE